MSTALLSFYTSDYQPLVDVTGPVKDAYCARHGYRHIVRSTSYRPVPGYYAYDRLAFIRDLFFGGLPEGKDIDVILCLNSHAQVMTHSITIESFLEQGKDFYIAADVNGLNAGVFILRKSEWLKTWLDFALANEAHYSQHEWFEQRCFQENWQRPEFKSHIMLVDQWLLNSYDWTHYNWPTTTPGQFRKGESFIFHVPGQSVRVGGNLSRLDSRIMVFSSAEVKESIIM